VGSEFYLLKDIVSSVQVDPDACATALGLSPKVFHEWLVGQKPIPSFILPQLSTVFGVSANDIISHRPTNESPAVWYKLRSSKLQDADRESVLLIRNLGFFLEQLEDVTGSRNVLWKSLFGDIFSRVDKQASPTDQGRSAAQLFRSAQQLNHGAHGIGRELRDRLRGIGLLVIESPLPKSVLEGFCFLVGQANSEVPCLAANTYGTTWFRRNLILLHELGHAIFDLDSESVTLDYRGEDDFSEFRERRAQAFAEEMLVPLKVIRHIQNTTAGFDWASLTARDLALLVAKTEAEARTVLSAALLHGLINDCQYEEYLHLNIAAELKQLTPRALSTREFLAQTFGEDVWAANKRTTTLSPRRLRLPVSYVKKVLSAARDEEISFGKAAEMMMIDKDTLVERFGRELRAI
jgi:Zn-dependent peptidase ImmA (M78 family)